MVTGKFARGRYQGREARVWPVPGAAGEPSDDAREESFVKTLTVEEVYVAAYDALRKDVRIPKFVCGIDEARCLQCALRSFTGNRCEA